MLFQLVIEGPDYGAYWSCPNWREVRRCIRAEKRLSGKATSIQKFRKLRFHR